MSHAIESQHFETDHYPVAVRTGRSGNRFFLAVRRRGLQSVVCYLEVSADESQERSRDRSAKILRVLDAGMDALRGVEV